MKKITTKQRKYDVRIGLISRKRNKKVRTKKQYKAYQDTSDRLNKWLLKSIENGLNVEIQENRRIIITLPSTMNFSTHYESTVIHLMAIRRLSVKTTRSQKSYSLKRVNFDELKIISTSAALVLTAELSKWDDAIRQNLRPRTENWDSDIFRKFTDLGFFDLFTHPPKSSPINSKATSSDKEKVNLAKYIKGKCGDSKKTRILKQAIKNIVGERIEKWTFLHSGIDEAITNVSHHAYPAFADFVDGDKNWYMTGSYNETTKELKIVFYDQGITIPKSLPTSKVWEKALEKLSTFSKLEGRRDETLLKAAVQLDRTSTEETDRGKGLQDMMEFIKKREDGYLAIMSAKGLYKMTIEDKIESVKTEHFNNGIHGTLIIWSAKLAK